MNIYDKIFIYFALSLPIAMIPISIGYYIREKANFQKKLCMDSENIKFYFAKSKVWEEKMQHTFKYYVKSRIDPTIESYNEKAISSSIFYTCLSIIQIIYSALVPVSLLFSEENSKITGALFGVFVTITSGIIALCKLKENRMRYMELRDKLFAERNHFIFGYKYYVKGGTNKFIETCEEIIALDYKNISEVLNNSSDEEEPT